MDVHVAKRRDVRATFYLVRPARRDPRHGLPATRSKGGVAVRVRLPAWMRACKRTQTRGARSADVCIAHVHVTTQRRPSLLDPSTCRRRRFAAHVGRCNAANSLRALRFLSSRVSSSHVRMRITSSSLVACVRRLRTTLSFHVSTRSDPGDVYGYGP